MTRQVNISDKQLFNELREINSTKKIVWMETLFAEYYLNQKVHWLKSIKTILASEYDSEIWRKNLGAIVVIKRYLYKYEGTYYDRGIPYFLLDKYKNDNKMKLILENEKYYLFYPIGIQDHE